MYTVNVKKVILEDNLFFDGQNLLHYKIEYPQFFLYKYQNKLNVINNVYKRRALALQQKVINNYFATAISFFVFSRIRQIPIRIFEISYIPTITFNENCAISLYYDEYAYTGGAHGTTFRTSDTWDIQSGCYVRMEDIVNYDNIEVGYIKHLIIDKIKETAENVESVYFSNFAENILCNFNNENFYLNMYGMVIYYQQYDIAPYAAGIPEFLIPYDNLIIMKPMCNN